MRSSEIHSFTCIRNEKNIMGRTIDAIYKARLTKLITLSFKSLRFHSYSEGTPLIHLHNFIRIVMDFFSNVAHIQTGQRTRVYECIIWTVGHNIHVHIVEPVLSAQ